MAARGEPMIWLMGLALVLCFVAVVVLAGKVALEGVNTFWPRQIDRVEMKAKSPGVAGRAFYGVPVREESFEPSPELRARIESLRAAGTLPEGSLDADGLAVRRLYRAGNRDVTNEPFIWTPLCEIESISKPETTVLLERTKWGIWIGTPSAIVKQTEIEATSTAALTPSTPGSRMERVVLADGKTYAQEYIAEGPRAVLDVFARYHAEAIARRGEISRIDDVQIGSINNRIAAANVAQRNADRRLSPVGVPLKPFPWLGWAAIVAATVAAGWASAAVSKRKTVTERLPIERVLLARGLIVLCVLGLVGLVSLRPWREGPISADEHTAITASVARTLADLRVEYEAADKAKKVLEREDLSWRLLVKDAGGTNFAPVAMTDPDQPMTMSQVVRLVDANALSGVGKIGVYLSRWGEFIGDDPREQNTDGGVFPVIFGTVMMTMLLSIIVVPFGVVAALYLREYARQGVVTSILRIAINNLAGVPSIVFGMFGLGFFCYTLGAYIDKGPEVATKYGQGLWWVYAAAAGVTAFGALVAAYLSRPTPGQPIQQWHRAMGFLTAALWFGAAALAVVLAAHTPYFSGFFTDKPDSTFGKRGLLWASLTLALLTLPVVIVATEEAVAAVPRTMREGSYGCGASKWQTIRRIVLPGAMPGIMTGMILAMARGAGEVAPLMLVGAMKLAPQLPFSTSFPFLHADRSFMHLGFHIFDLGLQSPDAEAARPLVWTTTLLLISIIVVLNLSAILIRARLKARGSGSAV